MNPPQEEQVPEKPELVVGLVGASGANLRAVAQAVGSALSPYGYTTVPVRLSKLMRDVKGGDQLKEIEPEEDRVWAHMDAGDEIRKQAGRNDAVAALGVGFMSNHREENFNGDPATGTAFVFDSLKHPDEIDSLRRVYRDRFTLISVHSPTEDRLTALATRIAKSHGEPQNVDAFRELAKKLMVRDEHDDEHSFGQNVRSAFTEGDVYVPNAPQEDLEKGIARYFRLFFGDPFLTPTRDEYAMFQTHAAAVRSADLSRQVGAAICGDDGEIVAVGCNEVPKAFGGQYWEGDDPDGRDFQLGYDSNKKQRDAALDEALERMKDAGLLEAGADLPALMKAIEGTRLANLTEFGRPVHAEMAALLDAARRGTPIKGHKLFSTTFPCHNCARHIIAAGVSEVVYREPYEKSMANDLHGDAVSVDPATEDQMKMVIRRFVGLGPPRYLDLFAKPKLRKDENGNRIPWEKTTASPRLVRTETAYLTDEDDFLDEARDALKEINLQTDDGGG